VTKTLCALVLLSAPAASQTLESAATTLKAASAAFSRSMSERPRELVRVAQAGVDACRTGRELERNSIRLRITPLGMLQHDVVLTYDGCKTRTDELLFGDEAAPWAARYFSAPGSPWGVILQTDAGSDKTVLNIFYFKPGADKAKTDVAAFSRLAQTSLVAQGRVDWGTLPFDVPAPLNFKSAHVVTE